jgi:hypothetical protein
MEHAGELPKRGIESRNDVEEEVEVLIPASEDLIESDRVLLREMPIYLPKETLIINGQHFDFKLDAERLAKAVKRAERGAPTSWHPISSLSLELGNSLPSQFSDRKPKKQFYNADNNRLELTLPEAFAAPNDDNNVLKAMAERSLNEQVKLGLLQSAGRSVRAKRGMEFFKGASLSVAPAVGVAVGFLERQQGAEAIAYGSGSAAGVAVAGLAIALAYSRKFDEKTHAWARGIAVKKSSFWHNQVIDDEAFREPLIELTPVEAPSSN